jgi:hypothetical protein
MPEEKNESPAKKTSMCKVGKSGDLDRIRRRVKDAKFFCSKCGRAARDRAYLCKPTDI